MALYIVYSYHTAQSVHGSQQHKYHYTTGAKSRTGKWGLRTMCGRDINRPNTGRFDEVPEQLVCPSCVKAMERYVRNNGFQE